MKKIIPGILLLVYLLSFTEFCQVLKFPVLFKHYTEYCEQGNDGFLTGFLADHYIYDDGNSLDDDTDDQLPFKQSSPSSANPDFCPPSFFHFNVVLTYLPETVFTSKESFLLPSCLAAIWQPPKILKSQALQMA